MRKKNIKKLKKIPASEFCQSHENFKRWLANNLDVLEKPLGKKLELKDKDRQLGENIIDIIAKPAKQEKKVSFLILCKLKRLNKNHLEQIRVLKEEVPKPSRIILLATDFSQELLNITKHIESKCSNFHIYLIKLELFKVLKTNIVVPLFRVIGPEEKKESNLESQKEKWPNKMEVFIWQ